MTKCLPFGRGQAAADRDSPIQARKPLGPASFRGEYGRVGRPQPPPDDCLPGGERAAHPARRRRGRPVAAVRSCSVAVSAGCAAVRERLAALPTAVGYQLGEYAQDLWLAGGLAALVAIVGPAATPEELGALGGVLGLVGMVNYFLRPVYLTVLSLVLRRSTRG